MEIKVRNCNENDNGGRRKVKDTAKRQEKIGKLVKVN